jgi:hypothetical protein
MGGLIIDVFLVYIVRALFRLTRELRTSDWKTGTARVASTTCPRIPFGCPVCEVAYVYDANGETYSGLDEIPFVWQSSADSFAAIHPPDTPVAIRANPKAPQRSFLVKRSVDKIAPDQSMQRAER